MNTYKFIIEAERERFMESAQRETHERYIVADSYQQAHDHVFVMLERAGWKINRVTGEKIILEDIRTVGTEDKQIQKEIR